MEETAQDDGRDAFREGRHGPDYVDVETEQACGGLAASGLTICKPWPMA